MTKNTYFENRDQNNAFIRCADFVAEMIVKYGPACMQESKSSSERTEKDQVV